MSLKTHGRYRYSPISGRPHYDWPDGKRLAFYLAVNVEHFHFGEGLGHTPSYATPQPDVRNYAWRDYGLRVGIWRLFDLFDELELPACLLVNSAVYDYAPQVLERARVRGDEIVAHGRTNSERQGDLGEAAERALIHEATATIARHEGQMPQGWLGPWISETKATPDLLKEEGYSYVLDWPLDDQPVWLTTRAGPLLAMPYPVEINDAPALLTRHHTAADFTGMIVDQFDEMLNQSAQQPLVCAISLHTPIVGQPFRLAQLRRALQHIRTQADNGQVWFTRPGEIAKHVATLPPGIVPGSET
ncbi:polysaccharide deacetylase family protein [Algihabitans albus]|uniref:polysaccharide deacetylase family protein n=1 Tax=Algihabitans albus TaxID=2164067 RepID=UPI0035D08F7F